MSAPTIIITIKILPVATKDEPFRISTMDEMNAMAVKPLDIDSHGLFFSLNAARGDQATEKAHRSLGVREEVSPASVKKNNTQRHQIVIAILV